MPEDTSAPFLGDLASAQPDADLPTPPQENMPGEFCQAYLLGLCRMYMGCPRCIPWDLPDVSSLLVAMDLAMHFTQQFCEAAEGKGEEFKWSENNMYAT